jgi:hypothetical protein
MLAAFDGRLLRREGRTLARAAEAQRTGALPAQRIAHWIGDSDDGVVECGLNIRDAEWNVLSLALLELLVLPGLASLAGAGLASLLLCFRH